MPINTGELPATSGGPFSTTDNNQDPRGPGVVPVPAPSGITQQNTPTVSNSANQQQQAASGGSSSGGSGINIAGTVGTIAGTAVGGPIGGAIGNVLGDIFGNLFNQGGIVGDKANGFADGGLQQDQPQTDPSIKNALATGYLVGALHQKNFGGTPDTLPDAAKQIQEKLGSSQDQDQNQGFAQGGMTSSNETLNNNINTQMAQKALMQAMGLDPQTNTTAGLPQNTNTLPNTNPTANTQAPIGLQNAMASGNANTLRGYADGGPPMGMPPQAQSQDPTQGKPPLSPGQTFQGDGSVKGPGGPTDDAIPAKLSNGEFVISAPAVSFFGVDKLTKMNEQGKQGFMQALQQVDKNQPNPQVGPQAPPQAPAQPAGPPQAPPMMQSKGGPSYKPTIRPKGSGYMGL